VIESRARVTTPQPARYVKQIVSHLGHRLTTRLEPDGTGVVEFDDGRCTLTVVADAVLLAARASDPAGLDHVREVLGRHLERFGGREGLRVTWSEPGRAGDQ
jgi:caffeoyl-CoA O-methyltransferase